jgi:Tol biopolymer transport system component
LIRVKALGLALLSSLLLASGAPAQNSTARRDGRILFVPLATSTEYAPHAVIRAVDPATGHMTTIAPAKIDTENPTPSPNGRRLAFTRGQFEGTAARGLFVADRNGHHARRIAKIAGISPTWSPDGSRLAYVWKGVVVFRSDGSRARRLPVQGSEMQVAWSSRNQLVISHMLDSPLLQLARPDGTGLRTLRRGQPDEAFVNPKWSPDGRRIVYEHWTRCGGSTCSGSDGMEIADLHGNVLQSLGGGNYPAWSPSGTKIAYATAAGVFIRSLTDGSTKQIFEGSLETAGIGWQPR